MTFTKDELECIKFLVKQELKEVVDEGKTIPEEMNLTFLSAEEKYKEFLENLLDKLK